MTARQGKLFGPPPVNRRIQRMHVCDAGTGETKQIVQFQCRKCSYQSGWYEVDTVTEAKRGLPCPRCNA